MYSFNDTNLLLTNEYGKKLYHEVAALLPVIDFHNHLDAAALAANKSFENIYRLWVQNDPYKHRAMRICGVAEDLITGSATEYDKFLAWAQCLTKTVGNPLFHWSCMELKQLFGIEELLTPENAESIWNTANGLLKNEQLKARNILEQLNVEIVCTSDDLSDSLEHHIALSKQGNKLKCLPSLRGDTIIAFQSPVFNAWVYKLQAATEITISDIQSYKEAVINRLNFFNAAGCLLSDHSLDSGFTFITTKEADAAGLFGQVLNGEHLSVNDHIRLQSHLLQFLGEEYAKRKWKMQLHIGAHRHTSTKLRNKVGPAGGYACIGSTVNVQSICNFLDALDQQDRLPPTILYTLNPADNAILASLTGSFSEDGVQGKIQFGPAWWYNDHYEGIVQQIKDLSSYGLLSTSIGMTTDSRSIVSMLRHQYYRRILCNTIGGWVAEGHLPDDWNLLSSMASNICYYNIKNWIKK